MLRYYYKLTKVFEAILNLFIVLVLNLIHVFKIIHYPIKTSNIIHVVGNGPSLTNEVPKIIEKREKTAIMVVNSFATTEFYEILKPNYYVLVDPVFFSIPIDERIKNIQDTTSNSLIDKTKWELNLFVPYSANRSTFINNIRNGSEFIKVICFKNIPVIGGSQKMNLVLFRYNLANPLFQNVLIASIFIAIKMNFKIINLWGADHSWLPNLKVLPDNSVVLSDKHICQSDNNNIKLINEDGTFKKLHSFLFQLSSMFREYHNINQLAKKMEIVITNRTKDSFIDAFKFK